MKTRGYHRSPANWMVLPGEESWEWWSRNADGVWERNPQGGGCDVLGIESISFDSAPFWSPGREESHEEAVSLRWEGLGLEASAGGRLWTHSTVMLQQQRMLVATLALTTESSAPTNSKSAPSRFEPAARMLPLPDDALTIWQELGRYTLALTRNERLLHLATLSSRALDADAAFEIRDIVAALQAHEFADAIQRIHLWTHSETDFAPQLACLFEEVSIVKEPRPAPILPVEESDLLPAKAAALRVHRERRQRRTILLAMAAIVYAGFFGVWWLSLQWRESRLQLAEARMSSTQPQIDQVLDSQSRWLEMEQAIDPNLYPVELFHQIVSMLPDEGIRLKEFRIENNHLILNGESSTVNHALGFQDRLSANPSLSRYAWSLPVPVIRDDNRADFRVEGTLDEEVFHEGQ